MSRLTILFVGRSEEITDLIPRFREEQIDVGLADSLQGALHYIQKSRPALVFSQAALPGYRVDSLLKEANGTEAFPPVVVYTRQGSASEAQRLMEMGAKDYWLTPLTWEKMATVLPSRAEPAPPRQTTPPKKDHTIIAEHPVMQRVLALARQIAPSKATVLISGESGTGKEMIARYVHGHSPREKGPFIAINCAALPEHLLESELFGHEKGAFTGAVSRKPGRFELAARGTILLDEISEMDIGLQAKLLRVLQEGEIDRVGGTETIPVDVRVLATTNRNLEESVEQGNFRQDLYYRLNVIPIKLPPLRERKEDILPLAGFFIRRYCREYGLAPLELGADARQWLLEYSWPGNVRELQNLMERAVLLAGKGPVQPRHFLIEDGQWLPEGELGVEGTGNGGQGIAVAAEDAMELVPLHVMEQKMIMKSLDHTEGNRTQASQLLGISVRTLRNKLNEYRKQGMDIP
ncbi:MAG: sigma 54-interacting transcriptional regulator [Desulfovibrionales bacterium]